MSKLARNRGASFEREIATYFTQTLGRKVKRILGQARDSGADLRVGRFLVECKRRRSLKTVYDWYHQVLRATNLVAKEEGTKVPMLTPVVVLRTDGNDALVIMSLEDWRESVRPELLYEPSPSEANNE